MRELPTIREGGRPGAPLEGGMEGGLLEGGRMGVSLEGRRGGVPQEGGKRRCPRPYSSVCSLQAWGGEQGKGRMGTDKYFDNLVAMIEESTRGLEL